MSFVFRIDKTVIMYKNNSISMLPFTRKYNRVVCYSTGNKVNDHNLLSLISRGNVSENRIKNIIQKHEVRET